MKRYSFNPENYKESLKLIISELLSLPEFKEKSIDKILKRHPKDLKFIFSRDNLIKGMEYFIENSFDFEEQELQVLIPKLKMKPTRTISGVTTVTVLTKPFACPGQCIFCPNDVRMPKSYIATEPGAQRALMNRFSPYFQVHNRLNALKSIGHPTDKIELLILGGTWSYYPKKYQIWFIKECFRAMNQFGQYAVIGLQESRNTTMIADRDAANKELDKKNIMMDISEYLKVDYNKELRNEVGDKPYNQLIQTQKFKDDFGKFIEKEDYDDPMANGYKRTTKDLWHELIEEQNTNSKDQTRCVGLVLETRPDTINAQEVFDLRRLGATKIQLGIQTLDDRISDLNKRGEHRVETSNAFKLLRMGGFKIHAHIMPNLYGATPELDLEVYKELFKSLDYKPDELKIYPTSIIKNTELYNLWKDGKYKPYSPDELVNLLADCIEATPEYCRLTRIIRDIPSTEIEDGNKTTNLREVAEFKLKKEDRRNGNIRAREIKEKKVTMKDLELDIIEYDTSISKEYFLQYITKEREIAGFLRLSIPNRNGNTEDTPYVNQITPELNDCAIIREVHVYGPSLELDKGSDGEAQHLGLGTKLIEKAKEICKDSGFTKLAVISSIGTREYYQKRGFELVEYYQVANL